MKCLIAQLSDIHIKGGLDPILSSAEAIASALYRRHIDSDVTCLLLSGDIAFSGAKEEYDQALPFIRTIVALLQSQKSGIVHVIAVPGNHDCDFSSHSFPRAATIEQLLKTSPDVVDNDAVTICTRVQDGFFTFLSELRSEPKKEGIERLHWVIPVPIGDRTIWFHGINASWMSSLNERYGKLQFPTDLIKNDQKGSGDIVVFALHHPLNWFQQGNMHELRTQFRHSADFVLSGHEHVQNVALVDDALSSQSGFVEAGALSADDGSPSSFNVLEIDLDAEQFQSLLLELDDDEYMPRDLAPAWSSFRSLPAKRYSGFEITPEFRARLSDPGARFTHPVKGALSLDDVFVFPDLRELSQQETDKTSRLSSNTFLGKGAADRALLIGEEKAGKTSLIFQLFQGFYDQGLVPVYLQASEISGTTEREMEASITTAVEREYGKDAAERFWKTKTAERVCLIDDYDRIRANERYRPGVIAYAKKHFQRLYISTTDTYQLEEYVLGSAATALKEFRTFLILPFGHRLRYHLIRKWTCGGNESVMPLAELTENVDRCERIVDNVLGNSFVPALPLFLLTLLQSIEARTHTDLSQSAFGHYYAYLITRGLNEARVKKEELDELFNYCAFLAYELEKAGAREIHVDDLRRFTNWYSETFTPVNIDRRMEQLTDAGILALRSGGIGFKYPYFRYYFLGKYYADQMQKKDAAAAELADEVRNKCRNLHVRENANTVLFLTHHTKETFVFDEIVAVLRGLFSKREPLRLESDVSALSELVESTSKTVVDEWDVEKNREKLRRLQDDLDDKKPSAAAAAAKEMRDEIEIQSASQGQPDPAKQLQVAAGERITEDEAAESANLLADLNVLFKTVDLLGQILKSYYGSLTNDTKRQFMREVFRGPLRALADFFAFLASKQDALVLEVEAEFARRDADVPEDKRRQVAQQAVFNTIGVISFVFIAKAADAVNASTLRTLTRELADTEGSVAAKIIQLAAVLDSSEEVPIVDIRSLLERLDGNIFAKKVVESLVFRHLYMFPTSVKEKQQIEDLLKFDMHGMRALDLKTKGSKITKKAS